MFAGIGGICIGFKQAGCQIVWANEKDKAACDTYRHNFGGGWLYECDIKEISPEDIPDIDILTAGFPCQPFSIAGKQQGFKDSRGNLFLEIARIAEAKRPKAIFLENVSNLAEHDGGKTFYIICKTLAELGYIIKYKVMEAHIYGNIPQPRSRVYITTFLDIDSRRHFSYPEPVDLTVNINDIINRSEKKHDIYYYGEKSYVYKNFSKEINQRDYIYRISDKGLIRVHDHLCPTLTANMGTYPDRVPIVCDDFGIRKLTLQECLDFQGFPQTFTFSQNITINDVYKQIGNSVCIPVIRRIAENLCRALNITE